MTKPVYITMASTRTPAMDIAWARVLVDAARVRNIPDIASVLMNVNRKKMKNCDGSYRCTWLERAYLELYYIALTNPARK